MMGRTHKLGGMITGMLIISRFPDKIVLLPGSAGMQNSVILSGAIMAGAVLGSMIPDIDHHSSTISRKWRMLGNTVGIFQAVARFFSNLLPKKGCSYVRSMAGHRGFTHSLGMCLLITLFEVLTYRLIPAEHTFHYAVLAVSVIAGICSHIFLDMLAGGAPLFAPLTMKRIALAKIKTGGMAERIFAGMELMILIMTAAAVFGVGIG